MITASIALVALSMAAALLMARSITKPVAELTKGAEIIGRGNLGHRVETKSGDEIGELTLAFNQMTAKRQRVEAELKDSEERYRSLFENAAEGILVADAETKKFLYANPAVCEMLGYSQSELVKLSIYDIHPEDKLEHVVSEFESQAGGEESLANDIPCSRKDGRIVYADVNAATIILDGSKCNVGFFTDITHRKRAESALKEIDLNKLIAHFENMLKRLIGEDISFTTVLGPKIGLIRADPGQVEQIIMNLAVNACDAMPKGGKITIETRSTNLDAAYCEQHSEVEPGVYVVMSVSDTGHGMDDETKEKIFEPFFTTKGLGKGTGLGLATVYGIVKQSGGHIRVCSEIDRGTTFKVYFPQTRLSAPPGQESVEPVIRKGSERVLLVEDDEALRKFTVKALERFGYNVRQAANGEQALVTVRERREQIDLLITDVVMPGMSGLELGRQTHTLIPGIKVLYISGYTENAIVHHGILDKGISLLQKPFTAQSLAHKVREVLDS